MNKIIKRLHQEKHPLTQKVVLELENLSNEIVALCQENIGENTHALKLKETKINLLKDKSLDFVAHWFVTAWVFDAVYIIDESEIKINIFLSELNAMGINNVTIQDLINFAIRAQIITKNYYEALTN